MAKLEERLRGVWNRLCRWSRHNQDASNTMVYLKMYSTAISASLLQSAHIRDVTGVPNFPAPFPFLDPLHNLFWLKLSYIFTLWQVVLLTFDIPFQLGCFLWLGGIIEAWLFLGFRLLNAVINSG